MAYADTTDYALYGLSAAGFDPTAISAALDAASSEADTYLAAVFTLPLQAPYPTVLKQKVCKLATWELLANRGFNPEQGTDTAVRLERQDTIRWFEQVAAGKVTLVGAVDSSTPPQQPEGGFTVITSVPRGWGDSGAF